MSQPTTRQELYDRLRETSKDAYVLSEMKRLGFWEQNAEQPTLTEDFIARETALAAQLRALYSERSRLDNQEAMLKEIRKQRMEESRRKRQETKLKRVQDRQIKAENWQKRKGKEILYLGENVSKGLSKTASDAELLRGSGLPVLTDAVSLAEAMNIPVGELRFLSFSREVSQTNHYIRFKMPKKTGGERHISAPMPRLKRAQYWILESILNKVLLHEAAHGFVIGKSIVSNATPHLKTGVVINLDVKDFFPTITYPRIKGVFRKIGYSDNVSTILALICTEIPVIETELDGQTWYVADGERHLPQGAPTSPALTNILCRKLDIRLKGLAHTLGFHYTRYADDMTFSSIKNETINGEKHVNLLLKSVKQIITDEGLTVHPDKTKVMRAGSRQEVTGITVNDTPSVSRKKMRQFRAFLHQTERDASVVGKKWGQSSDVLRSAIGFANYVAMVQPDKGKLLLAKTKAIVRKVNPDFKVKPRPIYLKKEGSAPVFTVISPENADNTPNAPKKSWWKIW